MFLNLFKLHTKFIKTSFFSKKHQGYRIHREYRLPGYIDTFDLYKQQFCLVHYAFWGLIKYRTEVLFEETIPNYVIMHEWFLPYNSDWKSSCPEEIRDHFHWRGQPYQSQKWIKGS